MSAAFVGSLAAQFGDFATVMGTTGGKHTTLLAWIAAEGADPR